MEVWIQITNAGLIPFSTGTFFVVLSIMAGSLEGASGGLAGSGEELGSEWEVKSCGGSSVHSQVR
jgi:hypothetical protein